MKRQPLVSVIVVTLNNLAILKNCLESLERQSYQDIEIIVVDNGSKENIKSLIEWNFPETVYIRLDKNHGFAGGNNVGIKKAKGKYIALINNDAVASQKWIESMVEAAEADADIGQVASIIIDGNDPDVLDSIGLGIAFDGMTKQAMRGLKAPELEEAAREVLLPSGCACMFRAAALEEVGLFDEDFFAYCEDADLGLRLRFAGWKAAAPPGALVTHYHSMTTGRYSTSKVYFVERNHFWVAVKNFPLAVLPALPFVTLYRLWLAGIHMLRSTGTMKGFRRNNRPLALVSAFVRAYIDMISKLPAMFKKRFSVGKKARLGMFKKISIIKRFKLPMSEILGENKQGQP
ncbi:MAG: hypothetical protein IEMM0002_0712 [bacterium]|nr:MAG: hypothetical protein IEMM0002_0712 [bacterium]